MLSNVPLPYLLLSYLIIFTVPILILHYLNFSCQLLHNITDNFINFTRIHLLTLYILILLISYGTHAEFTMKNFTLHSTYLRTHMVVLESIIHESSKFLTLYYPSLLNLPYCYTPLTKNPTRITLFARESVNLVQRLECHHMARYHVTPRANSTLR